MAILNNMAKSHRHNGKQKCLQKENFTGIILYQIQRKY